MPPALGRIQPEQPSVPPSTPRIVGSSTLSTTSSHGRGAASSRSQSRSMPRSGCPLLDGAALVHRCPELGRHGEHAPHELVPVGSPDPPHVEIAHQRLAGDLECDRALPRPGATGQHVDALVRFVEDSEQLGHRRLPATHVGKVVDRRLHLLGQDDVRDLVDTDEPGHPGRRELGRLDAAVSGSASRQSSIPLDEAEQRASGGVGPPGDGDAACSAPRDPESTAPRSSSSRASTVRKAAAAMSSRFATSQANAPAGSCPPSCWSNSPYQRSDGRSSVRRRTRPRSARPTPTPRPARTGRGCPEFPRS